MAVNWLHLPCSRISVSASALAFVRRGFRFDATDLHSHFESIGEEFSEQSWYSDLTSFAGLGEDPYPSVVAIFGALTGGELMNGTEEDFVPIENP